MHLRSMTFETRLAHQKAASPGDERSWVLSGGAEDPLQPLRIPLRLNISNLSLGDVRSWLGEDFS